MNPKEYKISSRKSIWYLVWCFIAVPMVALVTLLFAYSKPYMDFFVVVWIGLLAYLLMSVPTFILHLRYFFEDQNKLLKYDEASDSFTIMHHGGILHFKEKDIKSVVLNIRNKEGEATLVWYTWQYYFYLEIELHSGQKFHLTCLLFGNKTEIPFSCTIVDKSYPWLRWRSTSIRNDH